MLNYNQDDVNNMALCVWKEARGEGEAGMLAVANVIVNRALAWERAVSSPLHNVIYQRNQFSSMSISTDPEYNLQPQPGDAQYAYCLEMCPEVLTGESPDNTNGALYYANLSEVTSGWFRDVIAGSDGKGTVDHPLVATVGKQSFYK